MNDQTPVPELGLWYYAWMDPPSVGPPTTSGSGTICWNGWSRAVFPGLCRAAELGSKLGAGAFDETRFFKTRLEPHEHGSAYPEEQGGREGYRTPHFASHGSAGLTGLWAEENTRAALFRALAAARRSPPRGPRLRGRFFGGFGLARRIGRSRAAGGARPGVPQAPGRARPLRP